MQALSVPRQITKRKISLSISCRVCASSGRPMGASTRTIAPSTAIPSRKVVLRSLNGAGNLGQRTAVTVGDLPR
jgi:hypothetical protein